MYQIITRSGTQYEIRNGRITRCGDVPVVDRATGLPDDRAAVIVNEPFVLVSPPTVGHSLHFRIKRTGGEITSSPIQTIEHYCPTHDLFGCWLCCRPVQSLSDVNA